VSEARRPTRAEVAAAEGKTVPDVIEPDLRVLFCGINPGLYSGATGHHFARPGNRFWKALHLSGFTPVEVSPFDERSLPAYGLGITNLVERATATAAELSSDELVGGGERLAAKVRAFGPRFLACLGVDAYRTAFRDPRAAVGPRAERLGGTRVWILPNPSGLNAHYHLPALVDAFRALRDAVAHEEAAGPTSGPAAERQG
jgi:double-stranded uracil-DNA glycosylase